MADIILVLAANRDALTQFAKDSKFEIRADTITEFDSITTFPDVPFAMAGKVDSGTRGVAAFAVEKD